METETNTSSSNQIDVTPNKDGGVLKEIKKEGVGNESPGVGDTVFVHYVGTLAEDGTEFTSNAGMGHKNLFLAAAKET